MAYVENAATVDNGTQAPIGPLVARNAVPAAGAAVGCVVMVEVIVTVMTSTANGALNGRPVTGDCLNSREGNLRNYESPDGGLSGGGAGILDGMAATDTMR